VNLKTEEGVRKFEAIANAVSDLVLEYGGALSGEHGTASSAARSWRRFRIGAVRGIPHRQARL